MISTGDIMVRQGRLRISVGARSGHSRIALLEQSLSRGLAQYPLDSDTLFGPGSARHPELNCGLNGSDHQSRLDGTAVLSGCCRIQVGETRSRSVECFGIRTQPADRQPGAEFGRYAV